ncbi:MAG TPA: preprotein translocase subunit YajC [Polyangiaceae bacterium]|jgi:preprotein translocase subunit YajC|nr:preprotein translocase subunit YajC [Polyangiaceae bacterium]
MSSPLLSSDLLLAQNLPPKAVNGPGTPVVAQDASTPTASGGASQSPLSGFIMPLMMLVIFVPFFFLMNRKQKKEEKARASLKRGDRVMTNAGLIGELVETDDRIAKVKIAPGVTVQIVANTVTPFAEPEKAAAKDLKEAAEKK